MSDSTPYQVPNQPGRWRAILLAVIVHLALLAFLWFGIHWQSETPVAVEAEVWDPNIRDAAPLPPPDTEPAPVPSPAPQPELPPPVAEPPAPQPEVAKPDIALEKEKEKKRELDKQKQAKLEKEKQLKQAQEEQEKADRLKKEKQDADKKLAKQKADADAKRKAEADKLAAEKKQKQDAADAKAAEQRRKADLDRMMNQASSSSTSSKSGGIGDAARSQGPKGSPNYAGKIAALIRSHTAFEVPPDLAGNPAVEYAVDLFPDGSVRSVRLKKPSGVPGFDEAVARAINKSQPFPADTDGKVPSSISVIHKPKDSN